MVSFMGHHGENFSPCRFTWVPARDPIFSYAFSSIPMQSHAETHMGIFNRINLVTEGWRFDRNPRSQVNFYSKRLNTRRAAHRE